MKAARSSAHETRKTVESPSELELADGTRLVPQAEARPARLEGDANHAFSLADSMRHDAEPFQGYKRVAASASA